MPCPGAVMVVVSLPLATVVQSSLEHLTILLIKVSLFQENISDVTHNINHIHCHKATHSVLRIPQSIVMF